MQLPKDLLSGIYTKPRLFLCETDKSRICQLEPIGLNGTFKLNAHSELAFEASRVYNDAITGVTKVNPHYDKIEALRLVYLEGFGYFEIQGPDLSSDGIKESKSITAYSLEYTLAQKYLEDFWVNLGTIGSIEVTEAENAGDINKITPVTLYNPDRKELSLLHLVLEKAYGWSVNHVDASLQTLSRQFEVDRQSVYDFLMTEVCEKFNCYIVFDTINNEINVYAESLTSKFVGDGVTKTFIISPPFDKVGTVSIDGYKTTKYDYKAETGTLILEDAPESGAMIEAIDDALTKWETDVFVTFENLSQQIDINYDADSIKTVLTVTYGENGNIRESNLGLPYITDISYYYTLDWMGRDLYDAYTAYLQKSNELQAIYTDNTQKYLAISDKISFEKQRLSLEYSLVQSVNKDTVGTYYVRGGEAPNYYYTAVTLPDEWNVDTDYYSPDTTNVNEDKVENLYNALKQYYDGDEEWKSSLEKLERDFEFMKDYNYTLSNFISDLDKAITTADKDVAVNSFLDKMWYEIGKTPLETIYKAKYKEAQAANIEMGLDDEKNDDYGLYYPVVLILDSIDRAIKKRDETITKLDEERKTYTDHNAKIANSLLMDVFFEKYFNEKYPDPLIAEQKCLDALIRLSAFLREDELHLDDIIETSLDTVADSFKVQQDAMESGKIELNKLCQPQLQFSMTMANIYALPEFEPIIDQFQLGKVVKVGLRSDYIKQSRLLQVDINFDDFSDFSCEFGELTSLRSQSDIHADLLSQAVEAGKTVATNTSYWTKGADTATATDLKIQQGLLDAATQIKAIDGTQEVSIDKYGIHLRKKKTDSDEYDDRQGWIVNNQFLYSDDAFKTVKSVFGEYTVDNKTYWGLLAEAVIAGYIEGSKIVGTEIEGGTIQIGEYENEPGIYAFEVDEDGNVSMCGGTVQFTATENSIERVYESMEITSKDLQNQITEIKDKNMYNIEVVADGPTTMTEITDSTTLTCIVYSWDTDVTDTLDASLFNWIRTSSYPEEDEIWNAMPEHQGIKTLIIGVDDINENASFSCEVDLPEEQKEEANGN